MQHTSLPLSMLFPLRILLFIHTIIQVKAIYKEKGIMYSIIFFSPVLPLLSLLFSSNITAKCEQFENSLIINTSTEPFMYQPVFREERSSNLCKLYVRIVQFTPYNSYTSKLDIMIIPCSELFLPTLLRWTMSQDHTSHTTSN